MDSLALNKNTNKMINEQRAKWVPPVVGSNKIFERRADGRLWPCWLPEATVRFNRDTLSSCSSLQSFEYVAELKTDSLSSNAEPIIKGNYLQKGRKGVPSLKKGKNKFATPKHSSFTSGFLSPVSQHGTSSEKSVNESFTDQRNLKNHVQCLLNNTPVSTEKDFGIEEGLEFDSDKMSSAYTINSKISELSNSVTKSEKPQENKKNPKCTFKTLYVRPPSRKSSRRSKKNINNVKSTDTIFSVLPKMSFVDNEDGSEINIIELPLNFPDGFTKHKVDVPACENRRFSEAQFDLSPHCRQFRDHTEVFIDKNPPSSKKLIEEYKLTWGPPDSEDDSLLDMSPTVSECFSDLHSQADTICVNEFVAKIESITFREKPTCSHRYVKRSTETRSENRRKKNPESSSCKIKNLKVKKWDWDNINCADDIPAWFLNLIEGHYSKKYKQGKRRNANKC